MQSTQARRRAAPQPCGCALRGAGLRARRWFAAPAAGERGDRILHHHHLDHRGRRAPRPLDLLHARTTPARPRRRRTSSSTRPTGIFGNPYAITHCTSSDFALDQCPSNSQAGPDHGPRELRRQPRTTCSAPRRSSTSYPGRDRRRSSPSSCRPSTSRSTIPVAVRTGTDYGLRFTVQDITQVTPLAGADLTFWGFPAAPEPRRRTLPQRHPREPAGCSGLADTSCLGDADRGEHPRRIR